VDTITQFSPYQKLLHTLMYFNLLSYPSTFFSLYYLSFTFITLPLLFLFSFLQYIFTMMAAIKMVIIFHQENKRQVELVSEWKSY